MRPLDTLRLLAVIGVTACCAGPAQAQTFFDNPPVSVRPFFLVAGERFSATRTFDAVFGQIVQPLWGGGVQLASRNGFFFDVTVSRFNKRGERAFFFEDEGFGLGTPLTVTLTPVEFTFGGRFRPESRLSPYAGAGIGTYGYKETSPDFSEESTFEKRHVGYLAVGGVDYRISRLVGVSGDVQYTRVTGIVGSGGVSQSAGENDLGGIAARFRVLIGR
jgi:opacity protein-like surface antigen